MKHIESVDASGAAYLDAPSPVDPGLFSRQAGRPERTAERIGQFLELLRSAAAARPVAAKRK